MYHHHFDRIETEQTSNTKSLSPRLRIFKSYVSEKQKYETGRTHEINNNPNATKKFRIFRSFVGNEQVSESKVKTGVTNKILTTYYKEEYEGMNPSHKKISKVFTKAEGILFKKSIVQSAGTISNRSVISDECKEDNTVQQWNKILNSNYQELLNEQNLPLQEHRQFRVMPTYAISQFSDEKSIKLKCNEDYERDNTHNNYRFYDEGNHSVREEHYEELVIDPLSEELTKNIPVTTKTTLEQFSSKIMNKLYNIQSYLCRIKPLNANYYSLFSVLPNINQLSTEKFSSLLIVMSLLILILQILL